MDEAWRHACEVRWLAKRDGQAIANYLRLVVKHRGQEAADRLLADVRVLRSQVTNRKRG